MSNETKWTPGEWDVDFLTGSERYAVRSKSKYHIATMFKSAHMADGEDEANAHLIAAAPELAEATRKAEQLAEIASDWNLDEVEIDGDMVPTHELAAEFRAALAKAQAETPEAKQ